MFELLDKDRLLSHVVLPEDIKSISHKISEEIEKRGAVNEFTVPYQLKLLEELCESELGRYLLQNKGFNGYWTHYVATYPQRKSLDDMLPIENFILERAPHIVAIQQRFAIFLQENQKHIKNGAKLASIPSGMMGEFLNLDYSHINNIELVAIDYDPETLQDAQSCAAKKGLSTYVKAIQCDAWNLNLENEFDLISSNGLTIYEPDDDKVIALFAKFYQALKPDGSLVTSTLTLPPNSDSSCEWNFSQINSEDMRLHLLLFLDIIGLKARCFRSTNLIRQMLEKVGFHDIEFIADKANLFPTVVARK